jgi:hypothetical protein
VSLKEYDAGTIIIHKAEFGGTVNVREFRSSTLEEFIELRKYPETPGRVALKVHPEFKEEARDRGVVRVEVPLPREVFEIARRKGIPTERLVKAVQTLLLLEVLSFDSDLTLRDAIELGEEVTRRAWKKITQQ